MTTVFGAIVSYDAARGAGLIKADLGGRTIVFRTADQDALDKAPLMFERFSYEVQTAVDGGQDRAVNLNARASNPPVDELPCRKTSSAHIATGRAPGTSRDLNGLPGDLQEARGALMPRTGSSARETSENPDRGRADG